MKIPTPSDVVTSVKANLFFYFIKKLKADMLNLGYSGCWNAETEVQEWTSKTMLMIIAKNNI